MDIHTLEQIWTPYFFIDIQLIYNILVSGVQHDSIFIHD